MTLIRLYILIIAGIMRAGGDYPVDMPPPPPDCQVYEDLSYTCDAEPDMMYHDLECQSWSSDYDIVITLDTGAQCPVSYARQTELTLKGIQ